MACIDLGRYYRTRDLANTTTLGTDVLVCHPAQPYVIPPPLVPPGWLPLQLKMTFKYRWI